MAKNRYGYSAGDDEFFIAFRELHCLAVFPLRFISILKRSFSLRLSVVMTVENFTPSNSGDSSRMGISLAADTAKPEILIFFSSAL